MTPTPTRPATTRNPIDEALDEYMADALASGDPARTEDAERQLSIRGHRLFDSLVVKLRVERIPVRVLWHTTQRTDKRALTGSLPPVRSLKDPQTWVEHLAALIADDLRLPRKPWVDRILTLASEYARTDTEGAEQDGSRTG